MARVVIFARNRICIELINKLLARNDEIVAVLVRWPLQNTLLLKEIKKHCEQLDIEFYSILKVRKFERCLNKNH